MHKSLGFMIQQGRSKTLLDSIMFMGAEEFLDEVLFRVKDFLNRSQKEGVIRTNLPHDSLGKTMDLKLPIEGHGIETALDDIDSVLRHSVHTTAPGFMNP